MIAATVGASAPETNSDVSCWWVTGELAGQLPSYRTGNLSRWIREFPRTGTVEECPQVRWPALTERPDRNFRTVLGHAFIKRRGGKQALLGIDVLDDGTGIQRSRLHGHTTVFPIRQIPAQG